jgi:hypothetical protein
MQQLVHDSKSYLHFSSLSASIEWTVLEKTADDVMALLYAVKGDGKEQWRWVFERGGSIASAEGEKGWRQRVRMGRRTYGRLVSWSWAGIHGMNEEQVRL